MAIKTIGSAGDYTTTPLYTAYVKALGTLTENEEGQWTDDANYPRGAQSDVDFSGVTLSGFTITMGATTNKHDGDFGNGARIELATAFGGIYSVKNVTINDFSIRNTTATSGGARCILNTQDANFNRVIFKSDSTGNNSDTAEFSSSTIFKACRAEGKKICFDSLSTDSELLGCTAIGGVTGFSTASTLTTVKNCVGYNNTTDFSGSVPATANNNASEDGTHPGTSGVTISADPFDADGYTPASSGQLYHLGVDVGIDKDAANNDYDNPNPSIGAYESIGVGGVTIPVFMNHYRNQGIA